MRVKSALAVISIAMAFGVTTHSSAEAGWCRRNPGMCGPGVARRGLFYGQYPNTNYMAVVAPGPYYPYVYAPRGYWTDNPFWSYSASYWYPNWWPNRPRLYAVPPPIPVPVDCGGCRGGYPGGYLK